MDRSKLPILLNEEYYWQDIIGCQVLTETKNYLGYVYSIIESFSHDILEISSNTGDLMKSKKYLIPFVLGKIIKNVNLTKKIIIIDCSYVVCKDN